MIAVTASMEPDQTGMSPAPEPAARALSRLYATDKYRAHAAVRWTAYKARADCQECFAEQHENRGAGWPRNPARWIRSTKGVPNLMLCSVHQSLWKTRDAQ